MKRILVLGLMATTLLASAPAAAQREGGRGRAESSRANAPRAHQSADPGQRQRNWSRPAPAERRQPSAVRNTSVPASNAQPRWGGQRNDGPRRDAVNRPDRRPDRQWSGNRDRTPRATAPAARPSRPAVQPGREAPRNWNRNGNDRRDHDWNRNDNRGRPNWTDNDRRRDNVRDRNWDRDRTRDRDRDRDRNWRDNDRTRDWNNNRNWSHQQRLNNRDRWSDVRRWDNRWRNDRRYDWRHYRSLNRGFYRLPSYYAPSGWNYGYRRFSIGIYLSNILFTQNYWIDDPYEYRLPPAYGPLRWVRYYDDALLIDVRDGYVVDVIHDFFW